MSLSAEWKGEIYYSIEISDDFGKGNEFKCIACKQPMTFHRNLAGIKTQHFAHKTECPFETEPETAEHIELKKWCYENLVADVKYKPDSIMVGNQKPDILLELNGMKVAVECQCSKISFENWEQRTKDYSDKGIYVLWLFGKKYFPKGCFKTTETTEDDWPIGKEKRVSVVEKKMHYLNYGRIYHASNNEEDFTIFPVHFEPIFRPGPCDNCWWEENIENWNGECDDRCWVHANGLEGISGRELKSTKKMNLGMPLDNLSLCLIENEGYLLARFYDKKWWE